MTRTTVCGPLTLFLNLRLGAIGSTVGTEAHGQNIKQNQRSDKRNDDQQFHWYDLLVAVSQNTALCPEL